MSWRHGVCRCCGNPLPPWPLPCCGAGICGALDPINHFVVTVEFTPCPIFVCSSVIGAPCPTLGDFTRQSLAMTLGTHVVPATVFCPCGQAGSCEYLKVCLRRGDILQGWGGACAGQANTANHECNPNPGSLICANLPPDSPERALAFIRVTNAGLDVWDARYDFGVTKCPVTNTCGTCSTVNMLQVGGITFDAAIRAQLCAGQTVTQVTNATQPCLSFQPGGAPFCSQVVGSARIYTGQLTLSITRG